MKLHSKKSLTFWLFAFCLLVFANPGISNAETRASTIKRGKLAIGGKTRVYGQRCKLVVSPKSTDRELLIQCRGKTNSSTRSSDLGLVYLSLGEAVRLTGKNCIPTTISVSESLIDIACRKEASDPTPTPEPTVTVMPSPTSTPTLTPVPIANLVFLTANVVTLQTNSTVAFQVRNQSTTVTALDIQAKLPEGWNDVTQTPLMNCASVAPGGVCTIQISAGSTAYAQADVPLIGLNTSAALTRIDIIQTAPLTASVANLALSVNDPGLNTSLTGTPRQITLTNTGTVTALSVGYSAFPALPAGTTISPASCGDIAPSDTCTLTITPGNAPSSAPGDVNPDPIVLSISGSNTNTLAPNVQIVTYGSVYQGGYLFSVDDTTSSTLSIGGKVAAMSDISIAADWGGLGIDVGTSTYDTDPSGANNGAANTATILAALGAGSYASALCEASNDGGFSDWYLPAICEMTPYGGICAAGSTNIQQQLFDAAPSLGNISDGATYWSSTQFGVSPTTVSLFQLFASGGGSATFGDTKDTFYAARCVRFLN